MLRTLCLTPFLAFCVSAAILTDPSQVAGKTYDFVVVGAGAAGPVVAHRLAEDSSVTVLLIEAGPNDTGMQNVQIPEQLYTTVPNTFINYNYTYIPTSHVNNRPIPIPRGRLLGGSTSINFMLQNKGNPDFWNKWASLVGDQSWSYSSMSQYLTKYETFVKPKANLPGPQGYSPSVHGTKGPIQITLSNYLYTTAKKVISAAGQITGFQFNSEPNGSDMLGLSWAQMNIGNGLRWSSAAGYLHANSYTNKANFDTLVNTVATKVLFKSSLSGHKYVASGVNLATSPTSPTYTVNAAREVTLSAGATNTPQLLMLSGIGDPAILAPLGIQPIIANAQVGRNLQDHLIIELIWYVNTTSTYDDQIRNPLVEAAGVLEWNALRAGPMTQNLISLWSWHRINSSNSIFSSFSDPSPGGNSPHWEAMYYDGYLTTTGGSLPATGHFLTSTYGIISPTARGTVTINSTSAFVSPVLDAQFLNNDLDVGIMRVAYKEITNFINNAPALKGFVTSSYTDLSGLTTDAAIDAFNRNASFSICHPASSAAMGAVVNSKFVVNGTTNLRVVDLSVAPLMPAGHPTGMIYAMAEKAADVIKAAYAS